MSRDAIVLFSISLVNYLLTILINNIFTIEFFCRRKCSIDDKCWYIQNNFIEQIVTKYYKVVFNVTQDIVTYVYNNSLSNTSFRFISICHRTCIWNMTFATVFNYCNSTILRLSIKTASNTEIIFHNLLINVAWIKYN